MNSGSQVLVISDKELLEYLKIAQKILVAAKTELDVERLKEIVGAITNNNYQIIHEETERKLPIKKNYKLILSYLQKTRDNIDATDNEIKEFENYCNNNLLMSLAFTKEYDKLFNYLSDNKDINKSDLTVLYQYITGQKSKSINTSQMIDDIKVNIYKAHNFDDMDERFTQNLKKYK